MRVTRHVCDGAYCELVSVPYLGGPRDGETVLGRRCCMGALGRVVASVWPTRTAAGRCAYYRLALSHGALAWRYLGDTAPPDALTARDA